MYWKNRRGKGLDTKCRRNIYSKKLYPEQKRYLHSTDVGWNGCWSYHSCRKTNERFRSQILLIKRLLVISGWPLRSFLATTDLSENWCTGSKNWYKNSISWIWQWTELSWKQHRAIPWTTRYKSWTNLSSTIREWRFHWILQSQSAENYSQSERQTWII